MDIYNVIPDGYYMYIEDFEEEDRKEKPYERKREEMDW